MLRDIIKKEILDHLFTFKFVFTFALCTVLILLSVFTGIADYVTDQKDHAEAVALVRQGLNPPNSWSIIMQGGLRVHRPPQPLGTVVTGVERMVGRVSDVSSRVENNLADSKYESHPIFGIFGSLDLIFIVKIVLSLLAILFTYDAIVGEKEKGTLKLALANNIPRDRLILGKAVGGLISLMIPLLVPLLLSAIILALAPDLVFSGADWVRLLLIFLMFFLYLSVFFSLGLFVSATTSRSSTSFLVLLFVWVVFVMVIPEGAVVLAGQIRSVPSTNEIAARKSLFVRQQQQEMNEKMRQRMMTIRTQAEARSFGDALRQIEQEFNAKISENNAKIDDDYQLRKDAQQMLATNLSRISPASSLTFGSMSLARTGIDEYNRFMASVRVYKEIVRNWYNTDRNLRDPATGAVKQISPDTLAIMPQYSHQPESLRTSFVRALPDFALMIVMTVALFACAYVAFLRYDVR